MTCQKLNIKLIFRGDWNGLMAWPDWPRPPLFYDWSTPPLVQQTVVWSVKHFERIAANDHFLHDDGETIDVALVNSRHQRITAQYLWSRPQQLYSDNNNTNSNCYYYRVLGPPWSWIIDNYNCLVAEVFPWKMPPLPNCIFLEICVV